MTPKKKKVAKSKRAPAKKTGSRRASAKRKTARRPAGKKRTRAAAPRKARKASPRARAASRPRTLPSPEEQAGDFQGLSDTATADSESVDELLGEGNAFEADVVAGVEQADEDEGREVHTHEVSEDDVPEEYLDKD